MPGPWNEKAMPSVSHLSGVDMAYPMYVLPFHEFMAMDDWQPHQNLKAQGKIKEFDESMWGKIFFISHQWTAYNHPDPNKDQLHSLQHVLRRLANGEMSVKGNFVSEFVYGLDMEHTAAEWKKLLPESYFWIDFTSMPQPLAALPEEVQGAARHAGQVSDHREAQGVTEDVAVLVEQLKAAVDSIPSYIERCVEMIVLTPSVKHADRKGDCCDFNSWRQRGWCRLEFVASRLACRGDIPVMVIKSRETTPQYFNLCDTTKLCAGTGSFTISDDKFKVKRVLETMLAAKAKAEFDKGNLGLARGHVLLAAAFLAGLPTEAEAAAHEGRAPRVSELSELEQIKRQFHWRDDATEAKWLKATGTTLLHVACVNSKIGAVRELLATDEGKKMLNVKIKNILKCDRDVKLYKSQPTATKIHYDSTGLTPLAAAMMSPVATPELIELLIDAGAEPADHLGFMMGICLGKLANVEAYTKKLWCERPGPAPWINSLISVPHKIGEKPTPLCACAAWADAVEQKDKMVWLLANGANPKIGWDFLSGGSPLVALSMNPEADSACFDVLVAAGCDPNEVAKPWLKHKFVMGVLRLCKAVRPQKYSALDDLSILTMGGSPIHFASFIGNVRQLHSEPRARAQGRATQLLRCPRALHHHCSPPHPTLNSRFCVRPVVQIPNIKKLSELGAVNDKKNRFGQLPIAVLQTNMPDSHAPDILGSAIVPPQVKLKAAGLVVALSDKLGKGAPNQQPAIPAPIKVAEACCGAP